MAFGDDKGATSQLSSGGLSSSRLGFRGTEDLGGGLKANFVLEKGINLASGAAGAFDRQSWVGLSGGFGEFQLGNTYTAYDNVVGGADPALDANLFDPTAILASRNYVSNPTSNITYITPTFNGFTGYVSYSMVGNGSGNALTSFALNYANGPLSVSLAYQDQVDFATASAAADLVDKMTSVVGSYDFGAVKLLAGYGRTSLGDAKDYFVGADVPLSPQLTLSVGYASTKTPALARGSSYGATLAYALSKRTTVYAGYRNDNASAVANNGGVDSRLGVGLRHAF